MITRLSPLGICAVSLFAVVAAAAQSDQKQLCPQISVSCPAHSKDGQPFTFTARVSGGDPNIVPVYAWEVSAGKIIEGKGSSTITVLSEGSGGKSFTGTVSVSGFDPACPATASCSFINENNVPLSRRLGSYWTRSKRIQIARLSAFAVELGNQPGALGYLLVYPGQRGNSRESQYAATRAKEYLVKTHGLDAGRIVIVGGGFKAALTVELWIAPTGAMPPAANPTVDSGTLKVKRTRRTP